MFDFGYSLPIIVVLFLTTAFALNRILFRPMQAILDERDRRTSGTLKLSRKNVEEYSRLFEEYGRRVKQAQKEGYGLQDQARAESLLKRAHRISEARAQAEELIQRMKADIKQQVTLSQERLKADAEELSTRIATLLLRKSA